MLLSTSKTLSFLPFNMNIEDIRNYCNEKKAVTESFPFDEETLVFKVLDKMFLLTNLNGELTINVKCLPEKAIELREHYPAINAGYHMNKKHWNTISIDGSLSDDFIKAQIDNSYNLIVEKFTKNQKIIFQNTK